MDELDHFLLGILIAVFVSIGISLTLTSFGITPLIVILSCAVFGFVFSLIWNR